MGERWRAGVKARGEPQMSRMGADRYEGAHAEAQSRAKRDSEARRAAHPALANAECGGIERAMWEES
jgi:hypothetical protein